MLGKESVIDVLITKWDVIEASPEKENVIAFADHIEDEIRRRAGGRVGYVRFGGWLPTPSSGTSSWATGWKTCFRPG